MKTTKQSIDLEYKGTKKRLNLRTALISLCMFAFVGTSAQTGTVTVKLRNASVKELFSAIEKQTSYRFSYRDAEIKGKGNVTISVQNTELKILLVKELTKLNLTYKVSGNVIMILPLQSTDTPMDVDKTIAGSVKDEKGEPIIGANVTVKGRPSMGTITDVNGKFTLKVPQNATLQVSYIGFSSREIKVGNQNDVKVVLSEDTEMLEEVVVIGYGSMDKKEVTSAISHVSNKDFLSIGTVDPALQIQGKVAGVQIDNTAVGDPNNMSSIQVRGITSISAGTGPLVVIDGVIGGNIYSVNSNDIESIDVLKDGAASAIYGTRGSNGVILITTKKGARDGSIHTSYSGYVGWNFIENRLKSMSAAEYRKLRVPQGGTDFGSDTDWMDEVSRTGFSQSHTLALSGGNMRNNYRISLDFRKAHGIDLRSDRKEWGTRMSFSHTSKNGLFNFIGNIAPRVINKNNADWGVFDVALAANPTAPVYDPEDPTGRTFYNFNSQNLYTNNYNPVEKQLLEKSYDELKWLSWDITAKLNLLPLLSDNLSSTHSLTTQITLAQQINDNTYYWFIPSTATTEINNGRKGEASQSYSKDRQESLEWLVNYGLKTNGHNLNFMGGYSYQYWMSNGLSADNKDFSSDVFLYNNLGNGTYNLEEGRNGMSSYRNDSKLIAFFGRITYDYLSRYLMTFSLRYEGSSKFGNNNKWGTFPAASLGWRMSEETFMKDIAWIDDFKLRGDIGVTGNQNFGSYNSLATYKGFGYANYNGVYYQVWGPDKNVNPDLKWEKGINWNVGLDFTLFNRRLSGTVNYYHRKQQDLLGNYTVPVPPYLFSTTFVNVGTMRNTGIEIELDINAVKTKDFSYSIGFVGATNNNKFVRFSNDTYNGNPYWDTCNMPSPNNPGYLQRISEGERIGNFRTYRYAGVDDKGDWLVWSKENEKIPISEATENDKCITGNGLPKFTASLTNTFNYKNWDMTLYFRGAFGFDIFNVHEMYYGLQSSSKIANVLPVAYGDNKLITTGVNVLTDYFIEKGDYMKLDVMTVGYTWNIDKKFLRKVRLYATGNNLFTITRYSGVDPSVFATNGLTPGTIGGSKNYYPSTRQILFGVQVDF